MIAYFVRKLKDPVHHYIIPGVATREVNEINHQGWVFTVQNLFLSKNGINWDKPVFPSFSRPKLEKLWKVMGNYISSG